MRRLVVAVIVMASVATGCTRSTRADTIEIGALYPTTGAQGVGGAQEARGVGLAAEWANAHGGIHGRRVRLVAANAERAEAVPGALRSLRRRGVSVVIGSHGSAISAVAARVATEEKMTFWETGAVGELGPGVSGGRNFFRLAPMGASLGRAGIAFVGDELAAKLGAPRPLRYAVAFVDDAYGRSVGGGAMAELRRRNEALVASFPYDAQRADFAGLARRIGEARPDVLFVAAYLDDGVALRQAVLAARVPLLASVGTSSSYCMPSFGARLGDDAVGLFASDKPDAADVRPDALRPEGRAALAWVNARYQARYHEAMSAPALSGFSNAYAVLVHVLPAARTTAAGDVADAGQRVKLVEGTLANGGGLDLAPPRAPDAGGNRNAASVIWEWVAPRTRAVVWPPAFATHPVVALPISR